MSELAHDLRTRTQRFGLRVIRVVQSLQDDATGRVLCKQLLRCGTSVGANYRAACRARSPAEFRSKLGIVEEECDETIYWIELLIQADLVSEARVADLLKEADELLAITIASINTSKRNS